MTISYNFQYFIMKIVRDNDFIYTFTVVSLDYMGLFCELDVMH